jgi:hypothetical protein
MWTTIPFLGDPCYRVMDCVRIIRWRHDIFGRRILDVKLHRFVARGPTIAMPLSSSVATPARVLLFSLIAVAACSPLRGSAAPDPAGVALLVDNRSAHDVVVYLVDGMVPLRLGRVVGLTRSRLVVPSHAARSGAHVLLRSAGSADVLVSEGRAAAAGNVLALIVQPMLLQSSLDVLRFEP